MDINFKCKLSNFNLEVHERSVKGGVSLPPMHFPNK